MTAKALLLNNVPMDEDLLTNFVEVTLDLDVENIELSMGAALVTLSEYTKLDQAVVDLKGNQQSLGESISIEVLDPEQCDHKVVVDDLDTEYLSHQFLKLYIESTFADGEDVVSDCEVIPDSDWTVLTFTTSTVVETLLEREDHIPLPSENYHIQIKPFYRKFHSATVENQLREPSPDSMSHGEEDDSSNEFEDEVDHNGSDTDMSRSKDTNGSTQIKKSKESTNNVSAEMPSGLEEVGDATGRKKVGYRKGNSEKIVTETLAISEAKYKLLKGKLEGMNCKLEYSKLEEQLTIHSDDATVTKDSIMDLVLKVKKSSLPLSESDVQFLKRDKVKSFVKKIIEQELKDSVFQIEESALTIYSLVDIEDKLEEIGHRILCSETLELPEEIPMEKIRNFNIKCNELLLTVTYKDEENSISLTGLVEDVTLATDDLKKMVEDFQWHTKTFKITGTGAHFVNRHEIKKLEQIFSHAEIIKKIASDEEILFDYKCCKMEMKRLSSDLKSFEKGIEKHEVNLTDLEGDSLALVGRHLKMDHEFIDQFEKANHCCVIFDNLKHNVFLGSSTDSKSLKDTTQASFDSAKKQRRSNFYSKQRRVIRLPSCKLQIKPFGNIAREKTDLLVCGIDSKLTVSKTRVGQSILKLDRGLQNQMAAYSFSLNGVCVDQRNIPHTKSKAIAFIILNGWQPGVSDQQLKTAVMEVLDTANKMGMNSISFPPLGPGRAFKYPVTEASLAIIGAIDSFLKANSGHSKITLINCLAPDKDLFNEMNKAVDVVFKGIDGIGNDGSSSDSDDGKDSTSVQISSEDEEEETPELQMEALNSDSPLSIVVIHRNETDIALKFKSEMTKLWLHEEIFKPRVTTCIPPKIMNEIIKDAKSVGVWVSKVENPATKQVSFKIKGKKEDVHKMRNSITDKLFDLQQSERNILSDFAPKRGSVDFIKFASNCIDTVPSYWTQQSSSGPSLVDVDTNTCNAIANLVTQCWNQRLVGHGKDARNIPPNSSVKVIKVQRFENHSLFLKYSSKRKSIFGEMSERNRLCTKIEKLTGSKGVTETMQHLPSFMTQELYGEVNELYLFHGTKSDILNSICTQGLDNRLSSQQAMFGQGVYMAESSTKSDQYGDPRQSRVLHGTDLTMILTRATMGEVFLCDDKHESVATPQSPKLRRPPCMSCFKDCCTCAGLLHHSVLGDGKWLFREFVVYDKDQSYPEYFITYQRY